MAYSNGYDLTAVMSALENRVGFRQPLGTGAPTLSSAVTTTNSGRYFQDFHSLVTVENIKQTMYQPAANDADLITHLTNIRKAAIMRCLNGVFTGAHVYSVGPLYNRLGFNDQLITNSGKFVGYEINVANNPEAAIQLNSISLYFDSAVTFNVYLFKDGKLTPEFTQEVTTVANTITTVSLTDKVYGRGKYWLGYFQDDIGSAKAYLEQVACWEKTYLFTARPAETDATGATTFNRENLSYPSEPFGLNVDISSFKDHTASIKAKVAMFDEIIGLTLTYSVIEQMIYAVRSNGTERIVKDELERVGIQLDLNGAAPISDSPQVMGLKQRIDREMETVRKSFDPKPKAQVVSC